MPPRRKFGHTWWGQAWIEALEGRAQLDPNRLPRGRTYARKGLVSALKVSKGEVTARVKGSRPAPYRVTIGTHRFSAGDWEKLLGLIGRQLGHTAALLDGELPPELAEHARAAGVDLLPGPGDLWPRCSCPDSADPCKHAAAVCYLVADEVDADPFVLFLLRGKGREELLGELRARRSATARGEAAVEEGLAPEEAFARTPAPVPALPPAPLSPEHPPMVPADPPPGSELRVGTLTTLANDTAFRAWQLLSGQADQVVDLTAEEDLARRATYADDIGALAAAAGVPARELALWAIAWREAERGGLAALRETWQPPRARIAEARAELDDSDLPGETVVWRNRLTRGDLQLRFGKDGRWYRFTRTHLGWVPDAPGVLRPVDALS